ncbi:MAG: 30S ribosomal protein S14 [Opitutales bacterium]|nr:30S ribosomal protein S14 [Opitutales bacterium]
MAKKSSIAKNKKRAALVAKFSAVRDSLKKQLLDASLTDEQFWNLRRKLAKLPRNSSPIRVRNRCSITGRARGYRRWFGLSRLQLREMVSFGEIPGVTKSSW